jgi:coenzyme F420 hydrogenase subunit delta
MTGAQQQESEEREPEQARLRAGRSGDPLASEMDLAPRVPEYCRKPILILGCGNVLFGDDGFGPVVIEHLLAGYELPTTVCALDVGTGIRNLLFTISISPERPKRILLIDAIDRGGRPGEIFEVLLEDLPPAKVEGFSLHQVPTSNLAVELKRMGVDIRVMVAQTGFVPDRVEPGLSNALKDAVPRMCERIIREFLEIGRQTKSLTPA